MTRNQKEQIKNVIIVVLFLLAILLLYLLWQPENWTLNVSSILDRNEKEIPSAKELIVPQYIAISSGDGSFLLYTEEALNILWAAEEEIRSFFSENSSLEEISKEQYENAMENWASVQIALGIGLPFNDFCSYFCNGKADSSAENIYFDFISFSEASLESFFVADEGAEKYYRIVFTKKRNSVEVLSSLAQNSICVSYRADKILGGAGNAFIALGLESSLHRTDFTEEDSKVENFRIKMAESLFGENFDFVRRITDSHENITYMYGYAQKVLYAPKEGGFSYSAKNTANNSTDCFSDLNTAISFLASLGNLFEEDETGFILDSYSEKRSGKNIIRSFTFSQTLDGKPIYSDSFTGARVSLSGGEVISMQRNMIFTEKKQSTFSPKQTADAANVIASNSNHIYNILNNNTLAVASNDAFIQASDNTKSLITGYFRSEKDKALLPCWILETKNGTKFYFDLYTASPLGFERQGE